MNDLVAFAMRRAADKFAGRANEFNAAWFAAIFSELADVRPVIDGKIVRAILCGRPDVKVLGGGSHFRYCPIDE